MLWIAGFQVLGIETSPPARKALSKQGIPAVDSIEEAAFGEGFHVVLLNEVLEHVADFRGLSRQVCESLRHDGICWISVPDFSEWRLAAALRDLRAGRPATRELNLWEHLNCFTPENLRAVVSESGLRVLPRRWALEVAGTGAPCWRQPRSALRILRMGFRWFFRGAPTRTDLLAERPRSEGPGSTMGSD